MKPTTVDIQLQLTTYSDIFATLQASKDVAHIYGPYIRAIPKLPVGAEKGSIDISGSASSNVGWVYDESTGAIAANTTIETDESGTLYNTY